MTHETTDTERRPARSAVARGARVTAAATTVAALAARLVALVLVMAALLVTSLVGQERPLAEAPTRLTLEDALRLARENNPSYQMQRNDQSAADWQVREAYGQFLPSASANGAMSYTEAGVQRIGSLDFGAQSTDWYSSSYNLSLNWGLDGNTLFAVPNARANQRATTARIDAAEFTLESAVTLQYMSALRAQEGMEVARRQLDRARQNLELVETRVEAGAAAGIDGKQAEIDMGRAEVALIQAEQTLRNEKLRLMEQMGVTTGDDVELASAFEVFEPRWTREELISYAMELHPSLRAFVAQEKAAGAGVRQARSSYFPQVNLSTAFTGNAFEALNSDFLLNRELQAAEAQHENCMLLNRISAGLSQPLPDRPDECRSPTLSQSEIQEVLGSNEVFPFNFTKNPLSLTLRVSVPLFNGFTRERQLEQAEATANDALHQRRQEELRLRTAVTQAYSSVVAAHRVAQIEERNRALAEERLEMARQRYAIGAAPSQGSTAQGSTYLELLDALASLTTAERDYLAAVYDFHQSLAQLEAATGRSLRPVGTGGDGAQGSDDDIDAAGGTPPTRIGRG